MKSLFTVRNPILLNETIFNCDISCVCGWMLLLTAGKNLSRVRNLPLQQELAELSHPPPILLHKGDGHIFIVTSYVLPHGLLDSTNHKDRLKMVPCLGSGYEIGVVPVRLSFLLHFLKWTLRFS